MAVTILDRYKFSQAIESDIKWLKTYIFSRSFNLIFFIVPSTCSVPEFPSISASFPVFWSQSLFSYWLLWPSIFNVFLITSSQLGPLLLKMYGIDSGIFLVALLIFSHFSIYYDTMTLHFLYELICNTIKHKFMSYWTRNFKSMFLKPAKETATFVALKQFHFHYLQRKTCLLMIDN